MAWDLGTIAGIKIRVHWTFLILPIWFYFSSVLAGSGVIGAAITVAMVLAIFGCVLLHELGHALAARQFGIGTRDITLLPIGGIAALESMPRKPQHELWIAVAGPLVNVVIAAVIGAGLLLSPFTAVGLGRQFLTQLLIANVALVIFNMIPAFPMDGGRVLRSLLAMFLNYRRATTIAVRVGQFAAVAIGTFGLVSGNLLLMIVAGFVFLAAQAELNYLLASESRPSIQFFVPATRYPRSSQLLITDDGIWYLDKE